MFIRENNFIKFPLHLLKILLFKNVLLASHALFLVFLQKFSVQNADNIDLGLVDISCCEINSY